MGGESTGCSDETVDVFVESAWFEPIRTAQTGRATGIASDAQYRFARTVDTGSLVPGMELATKLILELCGGEPRKSWWPARLRPRPADAVRPGLCRPAVGPGDRARAHACRS
jgi:phenylalanyl-tRNA synthetase beta chain